MALPWFDARTSGRYDVEVAIAVKVGDTKAEGFWIALQFRRRNSETSFSIPKKDYYFPLVRGVDSYIKVTVIIEVF